MSARRQIRDCRGFTILEVIFAASILGLAMLAYVTLKANSRYSRVYAKEVSQAVNLGLGQLDDFYIDGYDSPLLTATAGTSHQYAEIAQLQVGDFSIADATWTVTDNCPSQLSKLVKFTVSWGSATSPKSMTFTQVQVRR